MIKCKHCGRDFTSGAFDLNFDNPFVTALGCFINCPHCHQENPYDTLADLPDYKLAALNRAGFFGLEYRGMQVSEVITNAVSTFVRNMDRVIAFPFMLSWLTASVVEHGELVRKKWDLLSGNADPTGPLDLPFVSQVWRAVEKAMIDQRRETTLQYGQVPSVIFSLFPIDAILKWRGTRGVGLAADSTLSSMVVNAWTAFEVLAEDLWVQCLNARPRLGFIAMNAEPQPGDDPRELEKKSKVKFQFPAYLLREPGFDPTERMGTVLSKKWRFENKEGAEDAYRSTFRDDADGVRTIFEHPPLGWLAQMRHVFVHNAGKADLEFVQSVSGHPRLCAFKPSEIIMLDGDLVVEMVSVAITQSKNLIAFVDNWLKKNPR